MSSLFNCPNCGNKVTVESNLLGQVLTCPHCGNRFSTPKQAVPVAKPPEESGLDFLSSVSSSSPGRNPIVRKKSPVGLFVAALVITLAIGGSVVIYPLVKRNRAAEEKAAEEMEKQVKQSQELDKQTDEVLKQNDELLKGVQNAEKTIKQDRENYGKIHSSDSGYGSTMKEVTAMFGDTKDLHEADVGSSSFIDATWRNELRTIRITFKYFSADERGVGEQEGAFCVVTKAWYNN